MSAKDRVNKLHENYNDLKGVLIDILNRLECLEECCKKGASGSSKKIEATKPAKTGGSLGL